MRTDQQLPQIEVGTRTVFGWPPVAMEKALDTARAYIAAQAEAWLRSDKCAEVSAVPLLSAPL